MKIRRRDFLKGVASGTALAAVSGPELSGAAERRDVPGTLGILYDATLCVGCQSCMVACKQANDMPPEHSGTEGIWDNPRDLSATTLNIIKKYEHGDGQLKDDVNGYSFIKRHCMHCLEPSCVSACPVSAMTKDEETGLEMTFMMLCSAGHSWIQGPAQHTAFLKKADTSSNGSDQTTATQSGATETKAWNCRFEPCVFSL